MTAFQDLYDFAAIARYGNVKKKRRAPWARRLDASRRCSALIPAVSVELGVG